MTITDWVGSVGVAILLVAFFLNLRNILHKDSLSYLVLNVVGDGLACVASILLNYWPFIILEGSWMVSSVGLVQYFKQSNVRKNRFS